MKKTILISLLLINSLFIKAQHIMYVPNDFNTLKEAHDAIPEILEENIEIRLVNNGEPISITSENSFTWNKSGTDNFSIKIISNDFENPTVLSKSFQSAIKIEDVKNIHFYNIIFDNAALSLFFLNVKNSSIKYCKFKGYYNNNPLPLGCSGGGLIHIQGKNSINKSENNKIINNFIDGINGSSIDCNQKWQSIYISEFTENNVVSGNTIINPAGSGINIGQGNQDSNYITGNYINKTYPDNNYPTISSMQCIRFGPEESSNNYIVNNYTFSDREIIGDKCVDCIQLAGNNSNIIIDHFLFSSNTIKNNHVDFGKKIYDPYWLNYKTSDVKNRIISGDFNKDGKIDDVVIFKITENNETTINTLLKRKDNSFTHAAKVLYNYNANLINGRMVNGDFDNDGYRNEIAVFYDKGNSTTEIHVFKFTGTSFTYSGWWNSNGYIANQIMGRVVSGDFDNDGYHDDIAAFYDFGNSTTKIHVFKSNKSNFSYSGSSGWWNSNGYIANQIMGRIVSGDFDNDGYHDDIAAFYDFGNSTTNIHVFKSNKSNFSYSGSSGWWNSNGYIANQITERVISGDFDNDGYHDDIAAFYDSGNSTTNIHVFKSNKSNFSYSGSSGFWKSNGYKAKQVKGRVVSGDFNSNGKVDGILGLYSYGNNKARTHIWNKASGVNYFDYMNGSSGYPWVLTYNSNQNESFVLKKSSFKNNHKINNIKNTDIYPNPIENVLSIHCKEFLDELYFLDLNGKPLKNIKIEPQSKMISFNISELGLTKGLYFVKLKTNKRVETKKIIVK